MMILYGLVADYKIYSAADAAGSGGDVLQHYGKFQDVRVPPRRTLLLEPTSASRPRPRMGVMTHHASALPRSTS